MRTVFIQGEAEESAPAREALAERFTRWCGDGPAGVHAALVELVLEDKLHRDGLLTQCTEADVERVLTEVVPERLQLEGDWLVVPGFLRSWVDFLDAEGLLMPEGNEPSRLRAAIDRCEGDYLSAMADPMRWSAAKFWSLTMREHGVDGEDEGAVERFFEAVEEDEVEVDRGIVDHLEEREAAEPEPAPAMWLPPVVLADEETLSDETSSAPISSRMRALHDWVGEGRELDESGALSEDQSAELTSAVSAEDDFEVDVLVAWAQHADLLRVVDGHLVPTRISGGLLEQPELLWSRLWQRFLALDELFDGLVDDEVELAEDEVLPELVRDTLHVLYSGATELPLDLLVDISAQSALDSEELAASEHEAFRTVLRRMLDQWALLGVVRVSTATAPEQIELIESAVPEGVEADPTMVELRPLGVRAARESLQSFGFVAPTVDEVARQPAEVLVRAALMSPASVAEPTITEWIDLRGSKDASLALTALLRRVDEPATRLTALAVLEHTEADGIEAVHELREDPIAGPSARVWLESRSSSVEGIVRSGDEVLVSLDAMAMTLEEDVEELVEDFQETPTTEQISLVEEISRTSHANAGAVLEALAQAHPDERVASAAERAAERLSTSVAD